MLSWKLEQCIIGIMVPIYIYAFLQVQQCFGISCLVLSAVAPTCLWPKVYPYYGIINCHACKPMNVYWRTFKCSDSYYGIVPDSSKHSCTDRHVLTSRDLDYARYMKGQACSTCVRARFRGISSTLFTRFEVLSSFQAHVYVVVIVMVTC